MKNWKLIWPLLWQIQNTFYTKYIIQIQHGNREPHTLSVYLNVIEIVRFKLNAPDYIVFFFSFFLFVEKWLENVSCMWCESNFSHIPWHNRNTRVSICNHGMHESLSHSYLVQTRSNLTRANRISPFRVSTRFDPTQMIGEAL